MSPAQRFLLVVVSDSDTDNDTDTVTGGAAQALDNLTYASDRRPRLPSGIVATPHWAPESERRVAARARRYLDRAAAGAELVLVHATSLGDVPAAVAALTDGPAVLALLVIDHDDHRHRVGSPTGTSEELCKLVAALPERITFQPSPGTVHVYTDTDDDVRLAADPFSQRWPPAADWVLRADLTCALTDSIQSHHVDRLRGAVAQTAFSAALAGFLDRQAGHDWSLLYYTGSVVARLIDDLEQHATRHGNPVVRGPSEHSLAASALARWQLDGTPFLITVTSGMADEFRGTLANLRAARAKGFIVCADSRPGQWRPFQGTIHDDEDSREVMRARGVPTVYCDRPSQLGERLAEAFAAYHADAGPVVLFVTREVLESTAAVAVPEPPPAQPRATTVDGLDRLVDLINTEPVRLLWQVGPVSPAATELVHVLARRAGIALADSLTHPGTVSRYRDRQVIDEYLGTLSMYGYSARVHQFLHADGKLRPRAEQAVLFLNSPIAEVDTPFSQLATKKLRPLQIVERAADLAPFADHGIAGDVTAILQSLVDRLAVVPEVLALRRAAIDSTVDSFSDVVGLLPVRPMSPNYFFRQLNAVLGGLIRNKGYTYTGVYDVGRAALSAVCNLPRTGPGFSGWFGRALMGDALSALPGVTYGREDNVIAFVGDGAAALVADVVPTLVRQIVVDRVALRRNLSIFRFVNGGHSVIRTYRESMRPTSVSGQTGVLTLNDGDWHRTIGDLTVHHRRLLDFPDLSIADQLREPGVLNLYTVPLNHNNEGDGLSIMGALGWQRDELSSRTLALLGSRDQKPERR